MKTELNSIKGSTSTDSRFKKKESLATVASIYRDFKLKERVLETKLAELEDRLRTEIVVHTETKNFLSRKQVSLNDGANSWQIKHEKEICLKDEDIKSTVTLRKNLLGRLYVLQNRKNIELIADSKEKELSRQQEEEKEATKNLLKRQNRAARTIVTEMRAYLKYKKEIEILKGIAKKEKKSVSSKKTKK